MPPPLIGNTEGFIPGVPAPAFPASGVVVTNNNPYDVVAYINLSGVTWTHMFVGNAAGTTVDLVGFISSSSVTVLIPAGGTFSLTYSIGAPTWTWIGGL